MPASGACELRGACRVQPRRAWARPSFPASRSSPGLAQLQAGELRNLDLAYAQLQITMHQEASLIVGTVRDAVPASATDIRGFLSDTLTMIGDHQARAGTVLCALP